MRRSLLACIALVASATGCYRITVNTGAPPATETVVKPWNHSFIVGLVPPAPVSTQQTCPSGVSQVITQRSFVNGLAAAFTGSIYTPIDIRATCASGPVRTSAAPAAPSAPTAVRSVSATRQ